LHRYLFILFFLVHFELTAFDNHLELEFSEKNLDKDYDFLPSQENSFDQSKDQNINLSYFGKKYFLELDEGNLSLKGIRNSYPKEVDVDVDISKIGIGYIKDYRLIKFSKYETSKLSQSYECYSFQAITIGGCSDADISITSSDPKYDPLGNNLISIEGQVNGYGIEYVDFDPNDFLDFFSRWEIGLFYSEHNFNWLTPLEEIKSNFLLNLSFNGIKLGDALSNEFSRLPQRSQWESIFITSRFIKEFYLNNNVGILSEVSLGFLSLKNYDTYSSIPSTNHMFKLGMFYRTNILEFLIFGEYYENNLLGYHPIIQNQRTENQLTKPFGQLGISFRLLYFID
jgi:hypothetical protein